MDIAEHYRGLLHHSGEVLTEMLADKESREALTTSHNHLLEYDLLKRAIACRPEVEALNYAVKEYQFALLALSTGQYRYAFSGLRLFFELMLSVIQFSAHEIDFRVWEKDGKDINWSALKDAQSGVLSAAFMSAFNPEFSQYAKQYAAIAETVYRECSEFVHGNAGTHAVLPSGITFDKKVFLSWNQKSDVMRIVLIFAFSARYLGHIEDESARKIEPMISDALGHLPAIQDFFDAQSENNNHV